jgi:hypothetical protein
MAEQLPNIEHQPKPIESLKSERPKDKLETRSESKSGQPDIEKIRGQIEHQALPTKEVKVGDGETKANLPNAVNRAMKNDAYAKSLQSIRSKLSGPERLASQIIHNPIIDRLSIISAETAARPAGVLGGASLALIGSLALLLFAKHYGITYNYLVIFMLYVFGFVIGLVVELLIKIVRPKRP